MLGTGGILRALALVAMGGMIVLAPVLWMWKTDRLYASLAPKLPVWDAQPSGVIPVGVATGRYPVTIEKLPIPLDRGRGGALASVGDLTLHVSRRGEFNRLAGEKPEQVSINVPFDWDTFEAADVGSSSKLSLGVRDLVLWREGERTQIFLSHLHFESERQCLQVRVSRADLPESFPADSTSAHLEWRTIFASEPCLDTALEITGMFSAGSIAPLDDGDLLVAVGDFALHLGRGGELSDAAQSTGNHYGKIIRISPDGGTPSIDSLGHRNPSGLVQDRDGQLWAVEHGPRGGDELNRILSGRNYGWPLHTLGAFYGSYRPLAEGPADLGRFEMPVFAWTPSIAVSSLVVLSGHEFPAWEGNLLVGSLKAATLFRIEILDGRVLVAEPIRLGRRIRDLAQAESGALYVLLDSAPHILRLTNAAKGARGESIAAAPRQLALCASCHQLEQGQAGDFVGPSLVGVWGRPIASLEGYPYSEALRSVEGRWNDRTLNAFLDDPQTFAPGTTMPDFDWDSGIRAIINRLRR